MAVFCDSKYEANSGPCSRSVTASTCDSDAYVVTTVALSEETKITVLVLWELSVESLQQLPDVGGCGDSRCDRVGTVAETDADWLINIQHVGIVVPAVWVQRWGGGAIFEAAANSNDQYQTQETL